MESFLYDQPHLQHKYQHDISFMKTPNNSDGFYCIPEKTLKQLIPAIWMINKDQKNIPQLIKMVSGEEISIKEIDKDGKLIPKHDVQRRVKDVEQIQHEPQV